MAMANKAVLAAMVLACASAGAQEIAWQTNFTQARQLAAEQKRLILMHFYTDNCEPCRLVEKQVFPDRNVVDAIEQNYIPVKLHERDNPDLVRKYGVSRFPADIIVTHAGLPLHRGSTPGNAREFTLLLNNVALQSGVGAARTAQASAMSTLPSHDQLKQWKQQATQDAGQLADQTQQTAVNAAGQVANQAATTGSEVAGQASQNALNQANKWGGQVNQAVTGATDQAVQAFQGYAQKANGYLAPGAQPQQAQPQPQASEPGPYATGPEATQPGQAVNNPYAGPPGSVAAYPSGAQPTLNRYVPQVGALPQANVPAQTSVPPQGPAGAYAQQSQLWQQNFVQQQKPTTPQPPQMVPVAQAPSLGLDGFCPVTLIEKKVWKKADARWGAIHRGRTYIFASEEAQTKFLADPDRFAPMMSGFDPVLYSSSGRLTQGKRDFGVVYRNQMYLFENAATREAFEKAPEQFVVPVQQAMLQSEQSGGKYR